MSNAALLPFVILLSLCWTGAQQHPLLSQALYVWRKKKKRENHVNNTNPKVEESVGNCIIVNESWEWVRKEGGPESCTCNRLGSWGCKIHHFLQRRVLKEGQLSEEKNADPSWSSINWSQRFWWPVIRCWLRCFWLKIYFATFHTMNYKPSFRSNVLSRPSLRTNSSPVRTIGYGSFKVKEHSLEVLGR